VPFDATLSRRRLLTGVGSLIAAHASVSLVNPQRAQAAEGPRIISLELLTSAPLQEMEEFYHGRLGLAVADRRSDRLTIAAGSSRITFVKTREGLPFYHFAFNIPENKIVAALEWQKARSAMLPIPERLRDPKYPIEVVDYRHWNAHSVFFLDPGGNVVEYIARHDLKNAAPGEFNAAGILCVSEIGLIVDDVLATASTLKQVVGTGQYRGGDEAFTALGDEHGLLLVMKRGRILNFNSATDEKAARVYRTVAHVRGSSGADYSFPNFPYEISVEG
jgi:catechol-2,3-dioxygenase